jgi:hypothetical protein
MSMLIRAQLVPTPRDLADQLASSSLPEPTRTLIEQVITRTKLWRRRPRRAGW